VESGFVCVEASGKVQEGIARGAMHKLTKEPKKKLKKKKGNGWADNLSARVPPLTSASEGGAFFTLRLPLALRPSLIWASCRLDLMILIRARHSRYLRSQLRPLRTPYPASPFPWKAGPSVIATPQISPSPLDPVSDDLLSGRSHVSSCLRSHCLDTRSRNSLMFLAPGATSFSSCPILKRYFCFCTPILLAVHPSSSFLA
jgi:hypothetical protein